MGASQCDFFSLDLWSIIKSNLMARHIYYTAHCMGKTKGDVWTVWTKRERTRLRGGTVSSQKSLSLLHAGTWSVKRFQLHRWTSCSDEFGLARADLVLSQTPYLHLVGKKNRYVQIPWFLLETIRGSEQKGPHSITAKSKLLGSLFCRTVVLVYSN